MLQPTDRVIAKTLAKTLGMFGVMTGVPNLEAANLVNALIRHVVGHNQEVLDATMTVIKEAVEELKAEADGLASPNVAATAQPWPEDAGSGV